MYDNGIHTPYIISNCVITIPNSSISQIRDFFPKISNIDDKMTEGEIIKMNNKIANGDDLQYYIMEYLENYDTYKNICGDSETEIWDDTRCENITNKVCREAAIIHNLDYIHGDLHENNVLVSRDNTIKIIDWGLSVQNDEASWEKEDDAYATDWSNEDRGKLMLNFVKCIMMSG
jgi:serine/threonine protein kinase